STAISLASDLGGYRGPGCLPRRVRDAVLASVVACCDRRLPELDRVEVRTGCVGVVLGARAGLELLHLGARQRVHGGLTEEDGLLRLDKRSAHPLGPEVCAVRVRSVRGEHPGVAPSSRPFLRNGVGVVLAAPAALQRDRLVRPRGANLHVAVLEELDLVAGEGPVLLDQGPLLPE